MSVDIYLNCDVCGGCLVDQNYTHNTNRMADEALAVGGVSAPDGWWWTLNGMTGPDGGLLLSTILHEFDANPDKYRAMNPANGWGDFDQFRDILRKLVQSVPESPTTWSTNG